jgi:hypothetical protein
VTADLSELARNGVATTWEFSERKHDQIIGRRALENGHLTFRVPSTAAALLRIG